MIVVLDTNVFHSDVHADRSQFRSILDDAATKGSFAVVVPDVVLQELDKQFARRSKKVVKTINKAVGEQESELQSLGMERPEAMVPDDEAVKAYRSTLEARLARGGARVAATPDNLEPAISWAVTRRKPFKESGEGFQDAVIWLTVLSLATEHEDDIVLVTSNTRDFGGDEPSGLAKVLADDLAARGRPHDQVRLVEGISAFVEEVAVQRLESVESAKRLAKDGAFEGPLESALVYSRLNQQGLSLGVELDTDPQVLAWDLLSLAVDSAAELPGGDLLIDATAKASVLIDAIVFKADYYLVEDDDAVTLAVTDSDYNEHYLEAETELVVCLDLEITTDPAGSDVQVEVRGVDLAPEELLARALRGSKLADLLESVRHEAEGEETDEYIPEQAIESDLDQVTVHSVYRGGSTRLRDVVESNGSTVVGDLVVSVDADVEWTANSPTIFDGDQFAGLRTDHENDASPLHDVETAAPLEIELTAAWDDEHGWHDLQIDRVALREIVLRSRRDRPTAAEALLGDLGEE